MKGNISISENRLLLLELTQNYIRKIIYPNLKCMLFEKSETQILMDLCIICHLIICAYGDQFMGKMVLMNTMAELIYSI